MNTHSTVSIEQETIVEERDFKEGVQNDASQTFTENSSAFDLEGKF